MDTIELKAKKEKQLNTRPKGLQDTDNLEDCFKRADELSGPGFYSAMLCTRKDLRRIVLLVSEVRRLQNG